MLREVFTCSAILTSSLAAPLLNQTRPESLIWSNCYNQSVPLKCAHLSVPIDWDDPTSERFNLFVTKIPARNASARIGNLFFEPGGPGDAPSDDFLPGSKALEFWTTSKLTEVFDLILPDPRGTGKSNPVRCNTTLWNERVSLFPETDKAYDEMVQHWQHVGQSCRNLTGPFLEYVDTVSAVKDYEAVRVALGNEPMNFMGQSYGAQFGAQYAEVFPGNIRAIVLDGILDHSQTGLLQSWQTESKGFEDTLDQFFDWCKSNATCVLHNETDIPAYFDQLIDETNARPVLYNPNGCTGSSCNQSVTGYDIIGTVQDFLCFPNGEGSFVGAPGFAGLAKLFQLATKTRNVDAFEPSLTDRETSYVYAYAAIICADWNISTANTTWAKYQNMMNLGKTGAPHTRGAGEFWNFNAQCQNWPVPPRNPPHEITTFRNGANKLTTPILLVNSFYDPETSYAWAANFQREFGDDNAVLLSRNGSGHSSYFQSGAVSDAIDGYLIHLKVPKPGTVLKNEGI